MCQAYKAGLYGARYVWFFLGWYSEDWFLPVDKSGRPKDEKPLGCTAEEMLQVVEGHFTTEAMMLGQENRSTDWGLVGN